MNPASSMRPVVLTVLRLAAMYYAVVLGGLLLQLAVGGGLVSAGIGAGWLLYRFWLFYYFGYTAMSRLSHGLVFKASLGACLSVCIDIPFVVAYAVFTGLPLRPSPVSLGVGLCRTGLDVLLACLGNARGRRGCFESG